MEYVNCGLCGCNEHVVLEVMGRFREPVTNVVCCKCGLVYQNPRMNSKELKKFYAADFSEKLYDLVGEELATLIDKHRYPYIKSYINTQIQKPSLNILEVGSGYGGLLELLRKDGHIVKGIEPSKSLYDLSIAKGLDISNICLEDFSSTVKYDLILGFHVLEHVDSPNAFMSKAKTLLQDDGRIIIETPDIWCLYGDPHRGDNYLFRKDHTFTFSEKTLNLLACNLGFVMNPLPRLTPEHIWVEFRSAALISQKIQEELKDDYIELVNHVLNYRANYNWRQRLFNNENLIRVQLYLKRLLGEKGLMFVKLCSRKVGFTKIIKKKPNAFIKGR